MSALLAQAWPIGWSVGFALLLLVIMSFSASASDESSLVVVKVRKKRSARPQCIESQTSSDYPGSSLTIFAAGHREQSATGWRFCWTIFCISFLVAQYKEIRWLRSTPVSPCQVLRSCQTRPFCGRCLLQEQAKALFRIRRRYVRRRFRHLST